MTPVRLGAPGTTRSCPHCRQTILESAIVCPACRHHLRFDPRAKPDTRPRFSALNVEGMIQHPVEGEAWEYSILVTVLDENGEEVTRHVAGVGVMRGPERRSFSLAVEVVTARDTIAPGD
jgi:hypothetical protein